MSASGIYAIVRKGTDECYIGSAVNIAKRWRDHRSDLRRGNHDSSRMQNVFNKHGADVFEYVILEDVSDKAHLIGREQAWLDLTRPAYNTLKIAGSSLGMKHTTEAIAAMSVAKIGKKDTNETKARKSAALKGNTRNLGRKHTDASRAKMSAFMMGNTWCTGHKDTDETRAKKSASRTGYKNTIEALANMSAAQKGRTKTAEHRAALSAAGTGKKLSPECRAALSVALTGKKKSPETRAAMSAAQFRRQATVRAQRLAA